MYSEKAIDRFRNPKYGGEMKDADAVGEIGNVVCGDIIKVYIKVKDDKITDIKFQTYGCVAAIASSDMLCELVVGKKIDEVYKMTHQDLVKSLDDLPPVKYHCSMMGMDALKKAIENYRKKE